MNHVKTLVRYLGTFNAMVLVKKERENLIATVSEKLEIRLAPLRASFSLLVLSYPS